MNGTDPLGSYEERAARFRAEADVTGRREQHVAHARLFAFAAGLFLLVRMEVRGGSTAGVLGLALALAAFALLVAVHDRLRRRRLRLTALATINREGVERLGRRFRALPVPPALPDLADHPYATDLDALGVASLEQLAGPTATSAGHARLREWLLAPAPAAEVARRQEAVQELAGEVELRDAFAAAGRLGGLPGAAEISRFQAWALGREPRRRLVSWVALAGFPVATAVLLTAALAGLLPGWPWLLALVAQTLLALVLAADAAARFEQAFPRSAMFRGSAPLFRLLREMRPRSAALKDLHGELEASGRHPDLAFRTLERLMELADARRNGFGFLLHLATLWQYHVLLALERWRRRHGPHVPVWFDRLASIDALSALAALRHDHPDWSFPVVRDGARPRLAARGLGHPLLRRDARVDNDVELPGPGGFLLVTGSNMSGKSTLLRTIGANAVLAQAGAPVCAAALEISSCRVWTSMRVQDSLERGVSRFLAELSRIRDVVAAAPAAGAPEPPLLYLFDEILQGTNTAERRIAARSVLRHLLRRHAFGAITTHDLTLADAPDLVRSATAVHFTEEVGRQDGRVTMTFDYRLRPGLAQSTNALVLVEMMGLATGAEDAPPEGEAAHREEG
jgi:hypothetical protein